MKEQKKYTIQSSPLYKLRTKRRLANLLKIDKNQLMRLVSDKYYNIFNLNTGRIIEEPTGLRKNVHRRLFQLLSRVETPNFLYSGKKGLSYIDNAKAHKNGQYVVTIDISAFYQSSDIEYIFRFFHYQLEMSQDIAWILAEVVTYKGHLPTGSATSQQLAYYAYSKLFKTIYHYSYNRGILFSLYVDDMTFSSKHPIPNTFHLAIKRILGASRLSIKRKKTRYYHKNDVKRVTGVIINTNSNLLIPNRSYKNFCDIKSRYKHIEDISDKDLYRLSGILSYMRQIIPKRFNNLYNYLKRLRRSRKFISNTTIQHI